MKPGKNDGEAFASGLPLFVAPYISTRVTTPWSLL
jgi:hypothetical protein